MQTTDFPRSGRLSQRPNPPINKTLSNLKMIKEFEFQRKKKPKELKHFGITRPLVPEKTFRKALKSLTKAEN